MVTCGTNQPEWAECRRCVVSQRFDQEFKKAPYFKEPVSRVFSYVVKPGAHPDGRKEVDTQMSIDIWA